MELLLGAYQELARASLSLETRLLQYRQLWYNKHVSEVNEKATEERKHSSVDIVTGLEAQAALNADVLRNLVHNLAQTTFDGPKITENMSRDEVQEILDRYGYPRSILREETLSSWTIAGLVRGIMNRVKGMLPSSVYDPDALQEAISAAQIHREERIFEQVKNTDDAEMLVAKVNGEVAGMLGIRRLGVVGGRRVYEHVKASVLPKYRNSGIFHQLKAKALEIMLQECPDPLLIVHTKTPTVRNWAVSQKHRVIDCEEYVARHETWNIPPDQLAALKKTWEEHGWEYFEVDLSS